jgi:small subunit ribosomal protein S18
MAYDRSRKKVYRKKFCAFCKNKKLVLNYKNTDLLRRFIAESGKIESMRLTGTCDKHQRRLAKEIKKARIMALLPFVTE